MPIEQTPPGLVRLYWEALFGFRKKTALLVALIAVAGVFEGAALVALIPALELGLTGKAASAKAAWLESLAKRGVGATLAVFAFLGLLSTLLRLAGEGGVLRLRSRVEASLRQRLTEALAAMRWSEFLKLQLGEISKAVIMEADYAAQGVEHFARGLGLAGVALVFTLLALFLSPPITLFTLALAVLAVVAYRVAGRRASRDARRQSEMGADLGNQATVLFGNLKYFRASGLGARMKSLAESTYQEYARAFFWGFFYGPLMRAGFEAAGIVAISLFLAYGLLYAGQSFAETLVVLGVFYRLAPRIMTAQDDLHQARVRSVWYSSWRRRWDQARAHREIHEGRRAPAFERDLRLEKLSFDFPGRPVLEGVDLSLPKGGVLAIVGESGSGKTTVTDLVTGLLEPTKGAVTLDGVPLRDLDLDAWRSRIGLVLQDNPAFHATVLENIAFGDPSPDRARAEKAARQVGAFEFVQRLPKGFDTVIGERGGALSGGERQRLALARALYRQPWLLILDEPTSALDSATENKILETLERLKGGVTILMVAHRLKTVRLADEIVVLENGRVREAGKWADLLGRRDGLFSRMAVLQDVRLD